MYLIEKLVVKPRDPAFWCAGKDLLLYMEVLSKYGVCGFPEQGVGLPAIECIPGSHLSLL